MVVCGQAAGVSFSRGHRVLRVPYDCCTPNIFNGEEFTMGARMWTCVHCQAPPRESKGCTRAHAHSPACRARARLGPVPGVVTLSR